MSKGYPDTGKNKKKYESIFVLHLNYKNVQNW